MKKKIGIPRFPGTNCDYDVWKFVQELGLEPTWLWYQDQASTADLFGIIIPGGFSYGDYLRCGALSAKSPVMKSVREFVSHGGPVLGICNGFQILCEAGLLPGVLLRNDSLKFQDEWVDLKVENSSPVFGAGHQKNQSLRLPIAHGEGKFFAEASTLAEMKDHGQIWLTYQKNVNGSVHNIAGVMNKTKNVYGLMPHPERALWDWAGGTDGRSFL